VRREPCRDEGTAHRGFLCNARASAVCGNRRAERSPRKQDQSSRGAGWLYAPPHTHATVETNARRTPNPQPFDHRGIEEASSPIGNSAAGSPRCGQVPADPPLGAGGGGSRLWRRPSAAAVHRGDAEEIFPDAHRLPVLGASQGGGGNHEEQRYCQTATKQADGVDRGEVRSVRRHTDRRSISHQGILHGGSKWTARRQSAVARENGSQTYKRLYGSDAGRAERTVDLRVQPPDGRQPDGKPPDGRPPDGKPPDGKPPDGKPPDGKPPPSSAAKSHQAERAAGCPQGRHPLRSARGTCARATAENC